MSILVDSQIQALCENTDTPMLSPFVPHQVKEDTEGNRIISYGLTSTGYDIRIAEEFKIFTNVNSTMIDPKNFDEASFVNVEGPSVIIPPNSFVLARSLEQFNMPEDVVGIIVGKSTLARSSIVCICTPAEPGWSGYLTLEFGNLSTLPVKLYANEGGCQVMFFRGDIPPTVTYSSRAGKYQNQPAEIVLPRV